MSVHIAFCDDEDSVLMLYRLMFSEEVSSNQLKLSLFSNGNDLLEYLKNDDSITAVISDINMPEMDGFELLTQIKEKHQNIIRYICSAYEREDYKNKAESLNINQYFSKHIDMDFMKEKIQNDLIEQGEKVKFAI